MDGIIMVFLSTPSGWRATYQKLEDDYHPDISIHALRVEGDLCAFFYLNGKSISIHALRVEGDACITITDTR